MEYILYKHPVQLDTLFVVQYLHHLGYDILPEYCIERNHPSWATDLPSIETIQGDRYIGLDECISFYETQTNQTDLLQRSSAFKQSNPNYRIHA